jgi:hypothetical protein
MLAAAWLVSLACAARAPAAPPPPPDPAVVKLEAAYDPIAKVAAGPDRVRRACADLKQLVAAIAGLPKAAPAGAAIDDEVWRASVDGLGLAVERLGAACRAPGLAVKHISGRVETADQRLIRVDAELRGVLDAARPRDLLPAMKRFVATLQLLRADPKGKRACAHVGELARILDGLEIPPPHTSTQRWEEAHARVAKDLDEIRRNRCRGARGAEVELVDAIVQVHGGFYRLVLALPPRD